VYNFDNFSTASASITTADTVYLRYGVDASKILPISFASQANVVETASSTPLSGARALTSFYGNTLTFGTPLDATTLQPLTGQGVSEFGITLLSRSQSGAATTNNFQVTATFSNNTTEVITGTINLSQATDDTFVSFRAPAGLTITSFSPILTSGASNRVEAFDDLGFVTVPEPSVAISLLGGFGMLLGFRRRRSGS
jgi:hypothetical protein